MNVCSSDWAIPCYAAPPLQRRLRPEECASCRFPTVDRFLEYVRNRRLVTFKKVWNVWACGG